MSFKRTISHEFDEMFNGRIILDQDIETKINTKHKVYKADLYSALEDPCLVVMKSKRKSSTPKHKEKSSGKLLEILGETESNRIIFIVGRFFNNGTLYIITAYWADLILERLYHQESEVLRNDH